MPGDLLEEWDKICKLPQGYSKNKRKAEFQSEVSAVKSNGHGEGFDFDTEFFRKLRKVEDVTKSGSTWSWVSWAKFVEVHGYEVALEIAHNGIVASRKYSWIDDATATLK